MSMNTNLEKDSDFHADDLNSYRNSSIDSYTEGSNDFHRTARLSSDCTFEALNESLNNMKQNQHPSTDRQSIRTVNINFLAFFSGEHDIEPSSKSVRFAEDTIFHESPYHIALSIPSCHLAKDMNCVVYTIKIICQDQAWSICRRYRDFEELNKSIIKEATKGYNGSNNGSGASSQNGTSVQIDKRLLPRLPKKRWFEKQWWLNRNNEKYSNERRLGLEQYLRTLLKYPSLKMESIALHQFLNDEQEIKVFTDSDKVHFKPRNMTDEVVDQVVTRGVDDEELAQEEGKEERPSEPDNVFEFANGISPYSDRDDSFSSCSNGYDSSGFSQNDKDEQDKVLRSFSGVRDSMALTSKPNESLMEAFYSDAVGDVAISLLKKSL